MSKYKRFTENYDSGFASDLDCRIAYNKLCAMENKIENRTLIEFPCNIGTEVYVKKHWYGMDVLRKSPKYMVHKTIVIEGQEFYHGEVVQFIITKKQVLMKIKFEKSKKWYQTLRYPISAMGKTVFLSVSDAEAKLRES